MTSRPTVLTFTDDGRQVEVDDVGLLNPAKDGLFEIRVDGKLVAAVSSTFKPNHPQDILDLARWAIAEPSTKGDEAEEADF